MDWQSFFDSPLAVWIPIIVLVTIILIALRKNIGNLLDNLQSGKVKVNKEGVEVDVERQTASSSAQEDTLASTGKPMSPSGGVVITDSESSAGGVLADDGTGAGVVIDGVTAKDDIIATSSAPPNPKAKPPA